MDRAAYEQLTGKRLEDKHENWRSLCPVHDEKTPSFFIHKETYLCHCFGCGASGMLDFVLASHLNVPMRTIRAELGIPLIKIQQLRQPENTFQKVWLAQFKRIEMHPYLKRRGFSVETVLLHGARWDPKGRIVFPLRNLGQDILGGMGRTVTDDEPKWYNYWAVKKGQILYQPLDVLKLDIIVEGIFDVMWLNQYGYQGAAALVGSKATRYQIELIKANTNEVTLFLDNDEAGRIGQEKLVRALTGSVRVYFARYPDNKLDPQELTEKELHEAIDQRQTFVEHASNR